MSSETSATTWISMFCWKSDEDTVSDDDFEVTLRAVRENRVKRVDLRTSCGDIKALATALATNTALTALKMDEAYIGVAGAKTLATALARNTTLTSLDLNCNDIGDVGATALATALAGNTALTKLLLGSNLIDTAGLTALATVLATNTTLTELDLGGNEFGDAGAMVLAKLLTTNTALTTLHLYICEIGDAGATALGKALETNTALTDLNLGDNDELGLTVHDEVQKFTRRNALFAQRRCSLLQLMMCAAHRRKLFVPAEIWSYVPGALLLLCGAP